MVATPLKTEAVVLRSIRFGEADCVLHLYTEECGKLGALAKGVRRPLSRFGGRLEPFFRSKLILHPGRGELYTVSSAETVHPHAKLRLRSDSLRRAGQACEAVLRLFDVVEPSQAVYNLLCRELWLLDSDPSAATRAQVLCFRMKLLLAAGFVPELSICAGCGATQLGSALRFSPSAGGVLCARCPEASFVFDSEAHQFLIDALAQPLAQAPQAPDRVLAQADRAIVETASHHAHVRLRTV